MNKQREKIGCVVVLYEHNFYTSNIYNTFILPNIERIDYILIFDNSVESQFISLPNAKYKYIYNGENLGLSYCYNKSADFFQSIGIKWMILLDQDTSFPSNSMDVYEDALNDSKSYIYAPFHFVKDNVLSPQKKRTLFLRHKGLNAKDCVGREWLLKDYECINSGMMISLPFFEKVGGYNEKVYLDFSDIQFLEKAAKYTRYFTSVDIFCEQNFSGEEKNPDKLLKRLRIYCDCGANYVSYSFKSAVRIKYLILRHVFAVAVKTHRFKDTLKILLETFK